MTAGFRSESPAGFVGIRTHASYIASWISLLKSDPKAIFTAASAASRAAGYLTSLQVDMA